MRNTWLTANIGRNCGWNWCSGGLQVVSHRWRSSGRKIACRSHSEETTKNGRKMTFYAFFDKDLILAGFGALWSGDVSMT